MGDEQTGTIPEPDEQADVLAESGPPEPQAEDLEEDPAANPQDEDLKRVKGA